MLAFITSLKHPSMIESLGTLQKVFAQTLRSLSGQQGRDIRIVVVGDESIPLPLKDIRIERLHSEVLPPCSLKEMKADPALLRIDRGKKYLEALYYLRDHPDKPPPDHVMFVDIDDWVSRRVGLFLQGIDPHAVVEADAGFLYEEGSDKLYRLAEEFHYYCGTCRVFPFGMLREALPLQMAEVPEAFYVNNLGSHVLVQEWIRQSGRPVVRFPFEAVTYVIGHAENLSGMNRDGILAFNKMSTEASCYRDIRPEFYEEFGLPAPVPRPWPANLGAAEGVKF